MKITMGEIKVLNSDSQNILQSVSEEYANYLAQYYDNLLLEFVLTPTVVNFNKHIERMKMREQIKRKIQSFFSEIGNRLYWAKQALVGNYGHDDCGEW